MNVTAGAFLSLRLTMRERHPGLESIKVADQGHVHRLKGPASSSAMLYLSKNASATPSRKNHDNSTKVAPKRGKSAAESPG